MEKNRIRPVTVGRSTRMSFSRQKEVLEMPNLIEVQKGKNWDFLFLGANIDVAAEAGRMGICRNNTVDYYCDSEGISEMYECVNEKVSHARMNGSFN